MKIDYGIPNIIEYKADKNEKHVRCKLCHYQVVVKNTENKCHECGTPYIELKQYIITIKYKDGTCEEELELAESAVDAWDDFCDTELL